MLDKPVRLAALAILIHIFAILFAPLAAQDLKTHITGRVEAGSYTNPQKDFRVVVPVQGELGGNVRDESFKGDETFVTQVVFTDDLGFFYRVVSLTGLRKRKLNVYSPLKVFHDIREQQEIYTANGLELRIINIEKAGAEVLVTEGGMGKVTSSYRPDLVTANAILTANGRIYHLTAGFPLYRGATLADVTEKVKKKLETFLAGFEPLATKKK